MIRHAATASNRPPAAPGRRRGFAFTDLLVVVAVLAVLAALVVPWLKASRAKSRLAQCLANLQQVARRRKRVPARQGRELDGRVALGHDALLRPRLIGALRQSLAQSRLTLISAPAGSGRLPGGPANAPLAATGAASTGAVALT